MLSEHSIYSQRLVECELATLLLVQTTIQFKLANAVDGALLPRLRLRLLAKRRVPHCRIRLVERRLVLIVVGEAESTARPLVE